MSPSRTLSQGDAEAAPGGPWARWKERFLPPRGAERIVFLILVALVIGLKVLTIYHYRVDSDETQHAHVVWTWATGGLQYRDVFDNHMPLFQIACAPLMKLLGPRADIILWLRWAMTPLYLFCLWVVFRLTESLFTRRIAPWVALSAAALPKFFYTSTEFRPDDLWAALWLLGLLVAVSGTFSVKRTLGFGLLLGVVFAVSLKTLVLAAGLLTATLAALALAWARREGPGVLGTVARLPLIVAGALVAPAATVAYFWSQGAYWIMYYCVVSHNIVPGLKRWSHMSIHVWIFPASVVALGLYGWMIFRQTRDTRLAIRRTIILLTPWFFLWILLSYWPDITREDDLPYVPLTPLLAVPVLMWAHGRFKLPGIEARFFTWILPAVIVIELAGIWTTTSLKADRVKVTVRSIRDVLALTGPGDYVMDQSGNYIFRTRPYYWAFETITKMRARMGLIKQSLPKALADKEVKMCYLFSAHVLPKETRFILSNYIPFDRNAGDLAVAGKELGAPGPDGAYAFDVAIPLTYAVVSETGTTAGLLDGVPYAGPVRLEAGHHLFRRTSGGGRAAIFLDRALAEGFHPQFDAWESMMKDELSGKKKKKRPEA